MKTWTALLAPPRSWTLRWVRGGQVILTLAVLGYVAWWVRRESGSLSLATLVPPRAGWGWALGAALAVPLNLALETAKWRVPLRGLLPGWGFGRAWQAVCAGITTGLFTPNRIGEYGGRLLFVPADQRWAAAAYTWVGRLAQMLATLIMGAVALGYLVLGPGLRLPVALPAALTPMTGLALGIGLALLAAGLGIWGLPRLRFGARWQGLRQAWTQVSPPVLAAMTGWALLRYAVFATQYVCLLYAFGAGLPVWLAFGLVGLVFWVKSLIPGLTLSELGIRESVALAIMVPYGVPATPVLAASLLLFSLNLLMPAIWGLGLLYRVRPRSFS